MKQEAVVRITTDTPAIVRMATDMARRLVIEELSNWREHVNDGFTSVGELVEQMDARLVQLRAEPRVWRRGDPVPPADVTLLRNAQWDASDPEQAGMRFLRRTEAGGWWWVDSLDEVPDPEGWAWPARDCGELVEVPTVGDPS